MLEFFADNEGWVFTGFFSSVEELTAKVDQQHELLRTIVKSMNIQTEAEVLDDQNMQSRRRKLSRFVDRTVLDKLRDSAEEDWLIACLIDGMCFSVCKTFGVKSHDFFIM